MTAGVVIDAVIKLPTRRTDSSSRSTDDVCAKAGGGDRAGGGHADVVLDHQPAELKHVGVGEELRDDEVEGAPCRGCGVERSVIALESKSQVVGDHFEDWCDSRREVADCGAAMSASFMPGNDTDSDILWDSGDGWVCAATIGTIFLAQAGTHTVKVKVSGAHCGIAQLDDMSLIIVQ